MFSSAWTEMLGGEITYFEAAGIRTRCLHAGSGEPLLLLHGNGGHAEAYVKNIIPLAARFRVCAIDMVGHGYTDKPEIEYSVADFVNHIRDFLTAAGAKKAHVLGESLGGWVAASYAIQYPDRVLSLILNTNAGLKLTEETPEAQARSVQRLQKLSNDAVAEPTRESVWRRLEWLFRDPERSVTEELVEIRYQIYRQPSSQRAMRRIVAQMTPEARAPYMLTRDQLRRIQVPTTIIWTRHNPTTPWQIAEEAHKIIGSSKFHVLENSAHWPQWEEPEEFNRLVLDSVSG